MILVQIILRKIIPRNDDLFKVIYVTKIKCSKRLPSHRTKGEIKTSFNFALILCKYVSKNGVLSYIHTPSYNYAEESNKKNRVYFTCI